MSPITHFLISWDLADLIPLERKDRALVTFAGVIPDLDGLGAIPELLTRNSAHPLFWYADYHHILGHNLLFGLLVALGSLALAKKRWQTGLLAFLIFHLHLPGGCRWRTRPRWLSVADPVSVSIFRRLAIGLARSMAVERLAEFCDYRCGGVPDVLACLETRIFPTRNGLRSRGSRLCANPAAAVWRAKKVLAP